MARNNSVLKDNVVAAVRNVKNNEKAYGPVVRAIMGALEGKVKRRDIAVWVAEGWTGHSEPDKATKGLAARYIFLARHSLGQRRAGELDVVSVEVQGAKYSTPDEALSAGAGFTATYRAWRAATRPLKETPKPENPQVAIVRKVQRLVTDDDAWVSGFLGLMGMEMYRDHFFTPQAWRSMVQRIQAKVGDVRVREVMGLRRAA